MSIYSVYVISENGSMNYHYDHVDIRISDTKEFDYPLPLKLKNHHGTIQVEFGAYDNIQIGHSLLSIKRKNDNFSVEPSGMAALDFLSEKSNYPIELSFGMAPLPVDSRIQLISMFHAMHHMARELSPAGRPCTGIQCLETDGFKAHCFETLSGIKFLLLTDSRLINADFCLQKLYEAYCDFALKNPFYILETPIRCSLFSKQVKFICENVERNNLTVL